VWVMYESFEGLFVRCLMRWFLLLFVPLASALVITPSAPSLSATWYTATVFNLTLYNDLNVSVQNLTWSPMTFFTFPPSIDLAVNETRVMSFSVYTNELFANRVFVSTASFFYLTNVSSVPSSFEVNVSASGFSVFPTLMVNDSIVWRNLFNSSVNVRGLGSGFSEVVIPAGGAVSMSYGSVGSLSFYIAQSGVAGGFSVIPRSGFLFAHDSSFDRIVSFSLSSVLPASTMQVTLLSPNISVNNNGTYREALIEVRNLDPYLVIQGVNVSADRWAFNFTPSTFNLPAGGVQRVLFNITPFVDRTNLTNRSSKIILSVKSSNAGSTVKDVDVFINYQNLDVMVINGVNYTLTFLGINQTAEACRQHRIGIGLYDSGYEECRKLEIVVNVTIIKEIPASYQFSQAQVKTYADSWSTLSGVAQRLENKQNLYLDSQSMTNLKVDNLTDILSNFSAYVLAREVERDRIVDNRNLRFWLVVSFASFFFLSSLIVGLLSNIELFDALERAGQ
jgi:hypothetical protein